ncbi:Vmc-like lipoprotein signal peptide domain-containing protein [Ureaplasma diversum]|uniref:Lipoprotein n=1 Tax=Ureaplasma diversum NCTC 246 TaxID=1188241 RepID=A0A084EWN4_9BACT|nr:hypothetical protein [Ureaplasma diversum]KEZ22376.1 Hypothetical protein, predicted lipoprotein [Ureaplasma diversum NCTC 246]
MKYKSKQKWLISSLVVLSAASISAVAVSCAPKNSNPTKPSKPKDNKNKDQPSNSLNNNPVQQPKDTPNNPTNPTKNQKEQSDSPDRMNDQTPGTQQNPPADKEKDKQGENDKNTSPEPAPEVLDETKPLLKFSDESPTIELYPGSNRARLSLILDKQKFNGELKNKYIIVKLKKDGTNIDATSMPIKLDQDANNLQIDFHPVVETAKYKLDSAFIFSEEKNEQQKPKEIINIIFSNKDKNKSIIVKKQQGKKEIPESEKDKKPIVIQLKQNNNELEIEVKSKDDNKPINGKYLKFAVTGLDKTTKEYITPSVDSSGDLLINNGMAKIPGILIDQDYKNKFEKVVLKIFGIYDNKTDMNKSTEYRFDYNDPNTLIDYNDNLILSKDIN